jgi:chromosome segregation protein
LWQTNTRTGYDMRLKSIVTHGFKSFADRVVIHYDRGITGIIGPNGSGKSNVIDAVRWVMGEQTAKSLRADDPTDVIFAGSQNRKGLSRAEVALCFTNDGNKCPPEYLHLPEVTIKRTIYKDNNREYHINGEPCRLKDIVDFLLAIGLGSKSYSIIQQERRDRIVSASPSDMREILEETASISLFKLRRKEAEKRILSTTDQLKNLQAIENELTDQREKLVVQVEKATNKKEYSEELKQTEVKLVSNRVGFFREKISVLNHHIQESEKEQEKKELESSELESTLNELVVERNSLTLELKEKEDFFLARKSSLVKFQERQQNFQTILQERQKRKNQIEEELQSDRNFFEREQERFLQLTTQIDELEKRSREFESELDSYENILEQTTEEYYTGKGKLEETRSEVRASEDLISKLRNSAENYLHSIEKSTKDKLNLQLEIDELKKTLGHLIADKASADANTNLSEKDVIEQLFANLEIEENKLQETYENVIKDRDMIKQTYLQNESTIKSLTEIEQGGTFLSDGSKLLKEELSEHLVGFVLENLGLHPEDEQIVELALPDLLQAAILKNTESLLEVLDYCEEKDSARIHLILADKISNLNAEELLKAEQILKLNGVRRPVLRASPQKEVLHLLERIFIFKDEWLLLKTQREILNSQNHGFLFITERGTVYNCATGFSFGRQTSGVSQGALSRQRHISLAKQQKIEIESQLASLEGAVFEAKQCLVELQTQKKELQQKLFLHKEEQSKFLNASGQIEIQIKMTTEQLQKLQKQQNFLEQEIQEEQKKYQHITNQIEILEKEIKQLRIDFSDGEFEFQNIVDKKNEISQKISSLKTSRTFEQEKIKTTIASYEELKYQMTRSQDKIDRNIFEYDSLKTQTDSSTQEIENLLSEIKNLEKLVFQVQEEMNLLQGEEAEKSESIRVAESRIKGTLTHRAEKQKQLQNRAIEKAQLESLLEVSLNDAFEKFKLASHELPVSAPENTEELKVWEKRIKELIKMIEELGPVNEGALKEFENVEERRFLLLKQKEDIEVSVLNLQKSIEEIENTTKTRFAQIYEQVNAEFQKLFPILFPGGEGFLKLLNPEDLLNTGVEINVTLPGKKTKNMAGFSGGEKALIAISLIFSLLKTTPTPFCFLDEVDAPLDEANVGRFKAVLESLSDQFQFIVITHNRRTMEVLDKIYGISMQEPGVSKLMAVDLTDVPAHLKKKKIELTTTKQNDAG